MATFDRSPVGGYVLAGGKSSRMGRDKALLELQGKPLVQIAVEKLREVCHAVHILGSRVELASFAPLVLDVHPGCGPLGGIEAALLDSSNEWTLILPVDVPFIPLNFIREWIAMVTGDEDARVGLCRVDGRLQPAFCLLHREVLPFIEAALERKEYKLLPVLEDAARRLAAERGVAPERSLVTVIPGESAWFVNLNTPEEFADALARGET